MLCFVENLIQQWDLVDIKPKRGRYTWSNNRIRAHHIAVRHDHFLIQSSLFLERKIFFSNIFPKFASDHKEILLHLKDEEEQGPIPFRFIPLWIKKEGLWETVSKSWESPSKGSPSFVWEQNLKLTKWDLKDWIKKDFKTPSSYRKEALQELSSLQMELEEK